MPRRKDVERLHRIVQCHADALDPGLRARALRVLQETSASTCGQGSHGSQWERTVSELFTLARQRPRRRDRFSTAWRSIALDAGRPGRAPDGMIDESQALAAGSSPLVDAVNHWMYRGARLRGGRRRGCDSPLRSGVSAQASAIGWAWWVSGATRIHRAARASAPAISSAPSAKPEQRCCSHVSTRTPLRSAGAVASIAQVALARRRARASRRFSGAWSAEAELTGIMADDDAQSSYGPTVH